MGKNKMSKIVKAGAAVGVATAAVVGAKKYNEIRKNSSKDRKSVV